MKRFICFFFFLLGYFIYTRNLRYRRRHFTFFLWLFFSKYLTGYGTYMTWFILVDVGFVIGKESRPLLLFIYFSVFGCEVSQIKEEVHLWKKKLW